MKPLQNNFTTPDQSKRLLELGVPADSADQVYYDDIMWCAHEFIPNDRTYSEIVAGHENISIPCWSAGRLIEIFELCTGRQLTRRMDRPLVEDVKCRIAFYIHHHKFDFSKLDD